MDKIVVNGTALITGKDFFVPLLADSPLFSDGVPGAWSFPVTIANDEAGINARALEFPNNPNTITRLPREYPCEVYLGGAMKFYAILLLINANDRAFEISVIKRLFYLDDTLKSTSIRSLFPDDLVMLDPPVVKIRFRLVGTGPGSFTFNVNGHGYAGSFDTSIDITLFNIAADVNADTDNNGVTLQIDGTGGYFFIVQNDPGPKITITYSDVQQALTGILEVILDDETSWLLDYNDDFLTALDLYKDEEYDGETIFFCFPTMRDNIFYGPRDDSDVAIINPSYTGYINMYDTAADKYLINFSSTEAWDGNKYTLAPQIFTRYVLDTIFGTAGLQLLGDFFTDYADVNKLYFANLRALDCLVTMQISLDQYLTFYGSFNAGDHLPDMTVSEFLAAWKDRFAQGFDTDQINQTVIVLQKEPTVVNKKINDWTNKGCLSNNWQHEKAVTGATFSFDTDPDDQYVTDPVYLDQFAGFSVGDGSLPIQCALSHMAEHFETKALTYIHTWRIPVASEKGSSLEFDLGINDIAPRLGIFRGLHPDSTGGNYPYGSNDMVDTDNLGTIGDISLLADFIFSNFYHRWLELLVNGIPLKVTLSLRVSDFMKYNWTDFVHLFASDLLIKNYQIEQQYNEEIITTLEMVRRAPSDTDFNAN